MKSLKSWSLQERLAAAILVAGVCVWPLVYLAQKGSSTAPRAGLSRQAGSIPQPSLPTAIPLENAPIEPRSMKPVVLAESKETGKLPAICGPWRNLQCVPAYAPDVPKHAVAGELWIDQKCHQWLFDGRVWEQILDPEHVWDAPTCPNKFKPNPKDVWL